jgi:hypothetical protein
MIFSVSGLAVEWYGVTAGSVTTAFAPLKLYPDLTLTVGSR